MKKFISVMLTLAIMASLTSVVLARPSFDPAGSMPSNMDTVANKILGFVQWVGYALAVGMLIYLGIKYVTSSANEKADLKKGSVNYVIGAVVIAAASTLVGLIFDFGETIS